MKLGPKQSIELATPGRERFPGYMSYAVAAGQLEYELRSQHFTGVSAFLITQHTNKVIVAQYQNDPNKMILETHGNETRVYVKPCLIPQIFAVFAAAQRASRAPRKITSEEEATVSKFLQAKYGNCS